MGEERKGEGDENLILAKISPLSSILSPKGREDLQAIFILCDAHDNKYEKFLLIEFQLNDIKYHRYKRFFFCAVSHFSKTSFADFKELSATGIPP